ncbi:MAG: hypothetical protein AW09_003477 [Candidatus Accumulibacter phosphatis]|uniref:Uncharacterized protein n=1 Tax=Candidatus Accumulibacter phosphatis TaxID=327160 RepID=A0A080LUN5_9PROT|nr:MAG: hypothetical protein AW09_003477 [Candidatus Accumulibacter phosphatis]
MLADPWRQQACAFDVVDDRLAWAAVEHVSGKEHQLTIGVDDLAVAGDDTEAVTIAVESESEFGAGAAERLDDISQVLWFRGIGVMVRKIAIYLAEQFHQLTSQRAKELRGEAAGDAVAAVDDDLHWPRQADVAGDAREVGRLDVGAAGLAGSVAEPAGVDTLPDALNRFASQRFAADDHFQAIIVGWIVAAGDGNATLTTKFMRREVDHRCRHAADVDAVDAGHANAFHQRRRQLRSRQAAVTAHRDRALAALDGQRTEAMADAPDDVCGQGLADDAANVVGLEDFGGQGSVHVKPRAESSQECAVAASRVAPAGCR